MTRRDPLDGQRRVHRLDDKVRLGTYRTFRHGQPLRQRKAPGRTTPRERIPHLALGSRTEKAHRDRSTTPLDDAIRTVDTARSRERAAPQTVVEIGRVIRLEVRVEPTPQAPLGPKRKRVREVVVGLVEKRGSRSLTENFTDPGCPAARDPDHEYALRVATVDTHRLTLRPAPSPRSASVDDAAYSEGMRWRRVARMIGTVLLAAGVLALVWGFATWQWGDPVTSLYTRWKQRDLERSYGRIADTYALPPRSAGSATASFDDIARAARRFRAASGAGQAIGRLEVPRLGLDVVVVNGTDTGQLKTGPGRDLHTFMPGEGELVYIAGHRTTYGAPFAHIDRLKPGDRVVLEMPYARAVYRVTRHVIVPADDIARLESHRREEIALQACHPRFSARERYIVYASPVRLTALRREGASAAAS